MRLVITLLGQLTQALLAEAAHEHGRPHGEQSLIRADIGGRLGAAYVLLARLKGQAVRGSALGVGRAADQPARHLAHEPLPGREQPKVRAAERERHAQRLPLARGDVGAALAWLLEQRAGDGIEDGDRTRAFALVRRGEAALPVLDQPPDVRRGDHDGGGVVVERSADGVCGDAPLRRGELHELGRQIRKIRRQHAPVVRGQGRGHQHALLARRMHGHQHRLGDRGRAFVQARVGDLEPREPGHLCLELEERLEAPLRGLGLVGRVGGQELAPADELVDHNGAEMVIGTAAHEADHVMRAVVVSGHLRQLALELELRLGRRQVEGIGEAQRLGNDLEEVIDSLDADRPEHDGLLVVCNLGVVHVRAVSVLVSSTTS